MEENARLASQAAQQADSAASIGLLLVSAMTFWEVAMLARRGRLALTQPPASWRLRVLELGLVEIPMSGDIGVLAAELEGFPADPADRIITATAMAQGATLITADARILEWTGQLSRHDARN